MVGLKRRLTDNADAAGNRNDTLADNLNRLNTIGGVSCTSGSGSSASMETISKVYHSQADNQASILTVIRGGKKVTLNLGAPSKSGGK